MPAQPTAKRPKPFPPVNGNRPARGQTASEEAAPAHTAAVDLLAKVRDHERAALLAAAEEAQIVPYFHPLSSPARASVVMECKRRIMLGSNNYLGLTDHPAVLEAAKAAIERYGSGLTGSRLLNGTTDLHLELEAELAAWSDAEAALVFTTGHQANLGALSALLSPTDTVIVDSADHASILDGCLLSRAKLRPYRHNRLDRLEVALQRAAADGGGVLVVVDGVFSMEGDIAPLPRIAALARRFGARLMVDEAHGAGVLGVAARGASELLGVEREVDLRMGTFSKSLASCGGFIVADADVSSTCGSPPAPSCSPPPRCRLRLAPPWRRCACCAPPRAGSARSGCWRTPGFFGMAWRRLALRWLARSGLARAPSRGRRGCARLRAARPWSPRSSRCWLATIGRLGCSGGPSTTPGCSSTPRSIRRCRPAGRCCAQA